MCVCVCVCVCGGCCLHLGSSARSPVPDKPETKQNSGTQNVLAADGPSHAAAWGAVSGPGGEGQPGEPQHLPSVPPLPAPHAPQARPSLWASLILLPLLRPLPGSSLEGPSGSSLPAEEFGLELCVHSLHANLDPPLRSHLLALLPAPLDGPPQVSWAFSSAACTPQVLPTDQMLTRVQSLQCSLPSLGAVGAWVAHAA